MKIEFTVGVYRGDDLVDIMRYRISADSLYRCLLPLILNDNVNFTVNIKSLKELQE